MVFSQSYLQQVLTGRRVGTRVYRIFVVVEVYVWKKDRFKSSVTSSFSTCSHIHALKKKSSTHLLTGRFEGLAVVG
jgi:hypothetical protein